MKIQLIILSALLGMCVPVCATPIEDWQWLEVSVRDGRIPESEARPKLDALIPAVSAYISANYELEVSTWVFPLEGYDIRALSRGGFQPGISYGPYGITGYNFFDGNRHGGHPAYDIFIRDKERDCLDDKTEKPVLAVAVEDCVALSINTGWQPGSLQRGGNYVWLYNPQDNLFFYYAHLNDVVVKPGVFVKKGGMIGTVGRTGRLARQKNSPTHLHLMSLEYIEGKLTPFNYYYKIRIKN